MPGPLTKCNIPMVAGDHPKLDKSALLNNSPSKHQMPIGMLNGVVILCQINVNYDVSSLSCFVTCPRKDVDLLEKLREQYPDAEELLDDKIPKPVFEKILITAYVNSDHAHNEGAIKTSTYGAEFRVMKTAVEE
eukprot:7850742-Ditylum_brightwellii.AAC.1